MLACLSSILKNGTNLILENWIRFQDWTMLSSFGKVCAEMQGTPTCFTQILPRTILPRTNPIVAYEITVFYENMAKTHSSLGEPKLL